MSSNTTYYSTPRGDYRKFAEAEADCVAHEEPLGVIVATIGDPVEFVVWNLTEKAAEDKKEGDRLLALARSERDAARQIKANGRTVWGAVYHYLKAL